MIELKVPTKITTKDTLNKYELKHCDKCDNDYAIFKTENQECINCKFEAMGIFLIDYQNKFK